ncbi:MAG: FIST C-terminal domain-containing protein [Candidatus Omnitrophica bacterium]|nr:FIST C-terminal domain-containing protein [Candidatus Omnitrophota bacterium]
MPRDRMLFASSIAKIQEPDAAAEAVLQGVSRQLNGSPCNAAFLFATALSPGQWEPIVRRIRQELKDPLLIGCTGGGVVGGDKEMEFTPALSLVAARLPDVELHPFAISPEDLEEPRDSGFWIEKLGCPPQEEPVGVLLPEPFSCDVMGLVAALNRVYPKMPFIGGIASGVEPEGGIGLFLNDQVIQEGAVGLLLTGNVTLETIVSQGCRPIGRPYIITKAEGNILLELAGLPAAEALRNLFLSLSDGDKGLARRALLLGVVMNEQKERFGRGDFLIRNLIGMDPESGGIAVGDHHIRVGQTVQFQVRDAESSREDLGILLKEHSEKLAGSSPAGALLFSCLGRGRDLYGESDYDSRTIQAAVGPCPMAGFFCNGEIGPVGGHNFIHGFTSSLGLFRPRVNP